MAAEDLWPAAAESHSASLIESKRGEAIRRRLNGTAAPTQALSAYEQLQYEQLIESERRTAKRLARAFAVFAYGSFNADLHAVRWRHGEDDERLAAASRLARGDLKPSKTLIESRIKPAAHRRLKRNRQDWLPANDESSNPEMGRFRPQWVGMVAAAAAVEEATVSAVVEAVLTADRPAEVFLPIPVPPATKFTQTATGTAIVPGEHLADDDLRVRLRTQVERLLEAEYEPEIAEFQRRSDLSWDKITQTAELTGSRSARRLEAQGGATSVQRIGLGVGFGSAEMFCVVCGQGCLNADAHTPSAEPTGTVFSGDEVEKGLACNLPETSGGPCARSARHYHSWDWRQRKHSIESSRGNRFDQHRVVPVRPRTGGYVDEDRTTIEVIARKGVIALDILEAERRTRPQRAAKIDELRALATKEQARLIEAALATAYINHKTGEPEWSSLARHLGKTEGAVAQLVLQIRTKAALAVPPPSWTRGRLLPVRLCAWCHLPAATSDHFTICLGPRDAVSTAA